MHHEKDEKKDEEGGKGVEEFLEERTLSGGAASVELLSAKGLEGKSFGEVAPMMLKFLINVYKMQNLSTARSTPQVGFFLYLKLFKS